MRQLAAVHAHAAVLGAAREAGYGLARIEPSLRVEGVLDRAESVELLGAELHAHLVDFFHADAMLAGDRAAHGDALLQHLGGKELGALQLLAVVGIEEDERMQVAVAGMEYVRAAQAVFLLQAGDELEHLAKALARDRAVHAV